MSFSSALFCITFSRHQDTQSVEAYIFRSPTDYLKSPRDWQCSERCGEGGMLAGGWGLDLTKSQVTNFSRNVPEAGAVKRIILVWVGQQPPYMWEGDQAIMRPNNPALVSLRELLSIQVTPDTIIHSNTRNNNSRAHTHRVQLLKGWERICF